MPMHYCISMPTAYAHTLCSTIARAMLCAFVCSRWRRRCFTPWCPWASSTILGVEAFITITLFLIFALPGVEAPDANDIADADEDAMSTVSSQAMKLAALTVTTLGVAAKTCSLCSSKSDEKSPLYIAHDDDATSGLRPWHRYVQHPDPAMSQFKVATARLCKLCFNAYFKSSISSHYNNIQVYLRHISGKEGVVRHQPFLHALRQYLKLLISSDGTDQRVHSRKELEAAVTVTKTKEEGVKEATAFDFIELSTREEKHPGQTQDKIDRMYLKEYQEERDGVWVRKGKKGHHEFQSFATSFVKQRAQLSTTERLCFQTNQLQNKSRVASDDIAGGEALYKVMTMED